VHSLDQRAERADGDREARSSTTRAERGCVPDIDAPYGTRPAAWPEVAESDSAYGPPHVRRIFLLAAPRRVQL